MKSRRLQKSNRAFAEKSEHYENVRRQSFTRIAYISLGRVYNNLCLLEKAAEFSQKGLNISKEIKLKKLEGHAYANFGHLYRHLGDLNTSFEFWEKALVFAKETGNKALEGFMYRNLALTFRDFSNFEKAIEFL